MGDSEFASTVEFKKEYESRYSTELTYEQFKKIYKSKEVKYAYIIETDAVKTCTKY